MEKGISGYIGEQYVLIELLRNNFKAYLPPSSTHKGWDILLLLDDKSIKVQVKSINWSKSRTTPGDFKNGDFDYLAIVIINFSPNVPYRVLIIPKDKLESKKSKNQSGCINTTNNKILYSIPTNNSSNITLTDYNLKNIRTIINKEYLNRWDLIK